MSKLPKVGSGFDCDFGSVVLDPSLCNACKNLYLKNDELSCYIYEEIPQKYNECSSYDCPNFIPNKETCWYPFVKKEIDKFFSENE
ncbi:TPA: hypothetical protein KOP46_000330 [Clostridioides difficile]|nr:hypothetical protein [Clostridioides difficile]